jgi:hypothetical protein
LKERHFDDIRSNTTAAPKDIPQNQFQNCFQEWTRCLYRCIASQGEYFESDHVGFQQWGTYIALLPRLVRELYCPITNIWILKIKCTFPRNVGNRSSNGAQSWFQNNRNLSYINGTTSKLNVFLDEEIFFIIWVKNMTEPRKMYRTIEFDVVSLPCTSRMYKLVIASYFHGVFIFNTQNTFRPDFLAIFRELQFWSTCTA